MSDYRLHNRIYPLSLPLPPAGGDGWANYPVFRGHTRGLATWSCHATTQSKGSVPHLLHSHREEEMVIVLAGEVEIAVPGFRVTWGGRGRGARTAGSETADPGSVAAGPAEKDLRRLRLRRGRVVYYPSRLPHAIETVSDEPANYLALSWTNHKRTYAPSVASFGVFDLDFQDEEGFTSRWVFRSPTRYLKLLQCHTTVATPSSGQDLHSDEYDVFHVVLEGEVETLDGAAGKNAVMVYVAGEPHAMFNSDSCTAKLLALELHGLPVGLSRRLAAKAWALPPRALRRARRRATRLLGSGAG